MKKVPQDEHLLKEIVEKAGGVYRGIQRRTSKVYPIKGLFDEDLVLFDDAKGSTKALPISQVTLERVKEKLGKK